MKKLCEGQFLHFFMRNSELVITNFMHQVFLVVLENTSDPSHPYSSLHPWRSLLHRNQVIQQVHKSVDWFLYDMNLCHKKMKPHLQPRLLSEVFTIKPPTSCEQDSKIGKKIRCAKQLSQYGMLFLGRHFEEKDFKSHGSILHEIMVFVIIGNKQRQLLEVFTKIGCS